jgi:hypothetical protein
MEISDFRISKDFYRAHDNPSEFWNPEKSFLGVYIYKGYYRDVYNT